MKTKVVELNCQADLKAKVIDIAALLLTDTQYSKKEAASALMLVAHEMSESETAMLRKLSKKIKK